MLNINAIASVLRGFADILEAHHDALTGDTTVPAGEPTAPKRQGRPRKTDQPSTTETAPAEQPTTTAPVEAKPTVPPIKGKTREELQALIAPLIQAARGVEVKAVINKYAPADFGVSETNNYTLSKLAEHPEHHMAFVKDIELLSM